MMTKRVILVGSLIIITFLLSALSSPATLNASIKTNNGFTSSSSQIITGTNSQSKLTGSAQKTVSWDTTNTTNSDSSSWTSGDWEFGSTPSYSLKFANNSLVGLKDTVKSTDTLKIDIKIPLDSIVSSNGLGQAGIYLNYQKYDYVPDPANPGSYNWQNTFIEEGNYYYDFINNSWLSATTYNNLTTNPYTITNNIPIFNLNTGTQQATYNTTGKYWLLHMEGSFDANVPAGQWDFSLKFLDTRANPIEFGYVAYNLNTSLLDRYIWVNAPYGASPQYDSYSSQVLSSDFTPLDSVTKSIPFEYQINVSSSSTLSKIIWSVDLPNEYYYNSYNVVQVPKEETFNGSWIWNSTINNYVWDSTPINVSQLVSENQTVQNPVLIDTTVNNTVCPAGNTYCFPGNEKLLVIFDPNTKTFSQKIGYELFWHDSSFNSYDQFIVLRNVNLTNLNDTLITFNNGAYIPTSSNTFTLNLNLSLNNLLYTPGIYQLNPTTLINATNGARISSNSGDASIFVNSETARIDVYDHNKKPAGTDFSVKLNDFFYVNMTLRGYTDLSSLASSDLKLTSTDTKLINNTYYGTDIQIIIKYFMSNHSYAIDVFNQTQRTIIINNYDVTEYYNQGTHSWVSYYPFADRSASQIYTTVLKVNTAYFTKSLDELSLSLNLSTTGNTPQDTYTFQGYFESSSFGQDLTTARSVFTTDFPVKQPVLTLNGTYVNYLQNQQSILFNGNYYYVNKNPYIETSPGIFNYIKSYPSINTYDQPSNSLVFEYDYIQGSPGNYYYELTNGTKINTTLKNAITIYTLQLPNGSLVKSYLKNTVYFCNYDSSSCVERLYTIDGSYIDFPGIVSLPIINSTNEYIGNYPDGYLVPLEIWNSTLNELQIVNYLQVSSQGQTYDPQNGSYYLLDPTTNTRYYLTYNSTSYNYDITVNGTTYETSATVINAYNVTINNQIRLVPGVFYGNLIIYQYFLVAGTDNYLPVMSNPAQSVIGLTNNVPINYSINYQGLNVQMVYNSTSTGYDLVFPNGSIFYGYYISYSDFVNFNGTYYAVTGITGMSSITLNGSYYIVNYNTTQIVQNHITYYDFPYLTINKVISTINIISAINQIILGNPNADMWSIKYWTVNPANGALDLDGNLATTNDQYFVKRTWISNTLYNYNETLMNVNIYWDPNTATANNEYDLNAWMGYTTQNYTWTWEQSYNWYYARNNSLVSQTDMNNIINTVFTNYTTQTPVVGYWGIYQMLINQTSAEFQQEAIANGWNWVQPNSWITNWLDFGFDQNYYSYSQQGNTSVWSQQEIKNEWNGLFIYNDSNGNGVPDFDKKEVTHMFIPGSVQSIVFTTPGSSLGLNANTGSVTMNETDPNYNTTLDFGVLFNNISGTTYPIIQNPFGNWINIWNWQQGSFAGTDLNNFTNRPTKANINKIGFTLHFNIVPDTQNSGNAIVNLKLDQTIGQWNVSSFNGMKSLTNYSLAITYLTSITTSNTYTIFDSTNQVVSNDQTFPSNNFTYDSNGNVFGLVNLAGNYIWNNNQTMQIATTTYSAPISQFQSTYQSSNGDGTTFGFNLQSTMYFFAIGFSKWNGYTVEQDPTFSAIAAVSGQSGPPVITVAPNDASVPTGQSVQLSWTATSSNPFNYKVTDDTGTIICSGPWSSSVPVTCTISAIKSGAHTYTITFYDTNGNSIQDSVVITGTNISSSGTVTISEHTNSSAVNRKKGVPGFELVPFLMAVVIVIPIISSRRKRH